MLDSGERGGDPATGACGASMPTQVQALGRLQEHTQCQGGKPTQGYSYECIMGHSPVLALTPA